MEFSRGGHLLGGALLVAGTAIGGGMLALPVLTAPGGILPAILIFCLCWLFMTATGLLLVEVFLWSKKEVNLVSMAQMTLGKAGKFAAWILYIFLFYSLTTAYVAGGGGLVNDLFERLPTWVCPILFVCIFAPFVTFGARAVDRINLLLMGGLILSFFTFVVLGITKVELNLLNRVNFPLALLATPVIFTSFAYQGIVPTLTNYLGRDPKRVKKAIVIGTSIPLFCYIVWEILILGVLPLESLEKARELGYTAVQPLKEAFHLPWLYSVGEFLAFFTLVTSFLGVTLGLLDFLADGLKVKKTVNGRLLLSLMIFLPPLAFALANPYIFLDALHYAGGIGCALLLGLLPILMAWRGRYVLNFKSESPLFGGRLVLSLLVLFIVFELILMLVKIL